MKVMLGYIRLVVFMLVAMITVVATLLASIFGQKVAFKVFLSFTRLLRFVLNIHVHIHGEVPALQAVIMSNHRSYIDVVLIPSRIPYVIVAKRSVRSWPLVGQVAMAIRTIFVDRDSAESRKRTREGIRERLAEGLSVLIFPEGTTFEGPGVIDFKPGIFRHCAAEGFPVIPTAIEFRNKDMAWIGDDTFLRHFVEAFGHWRIDVDLSMGEPLTMDDGDALRMATQQWVDQETRRLSSLQQQAS